MSVKCKFCVFESGGLCTKKTRKGSPTSIKVNKKRNCDLYQEDPVRVLTDYRARQKAKAMHKKSAAVFNKVKQHMEKEKGSDDR